ncbi:uncharacterized protein LOC103705346 isoform X1 [Phoenix dactylifera]|uniref:Uncharacterized protein LOC103705346 isoform X1 n=1 Tax=Phoenix dactylifera TaxID=42345 RepID=A0A8B7BX87_PHODC|nr:uncharacterized protein LOC103705346 isoform X1 [Phoenix dactylifera]
MATRCLSPNPSRPLNLNPKTPDSSGSSIRKSTNSNPFKASNPSDVPQRNSGSKSGAVPSSPRSSFEQKENERDLNCSKTARVRSPVMPCLKGVKNFMAPTISTTSKAIAASPKRRILAERNEVVRSSLTSVSDPHESLAMEEVVSKPQLGCAPHTLHHDAANFSKVPSEELGSKDSVPKSETAFGFQEVSDGAGSTKVDLEVKNLQPVIASSFSPSPAIAPLDADPSLPPYDPKTNYLSPRPQFLRYRPNHRIEHYLSKEGHLLDIGDGKQLEDSFPSESCEATSSRTEEVQSSDSQKDSEEVSSSNEVEVMRATDATLVSETEFIPDSNGKHTKSRSFVKFKFIALLLVLLIPFLLVPSSDSPILSSTSASSVSKAPALWFFEVLPFRNHLTASSMNLQELTRSLGKWSINSFSYYTTVASLPKEEEFSLLYVANLTTALVIDEGLEKYEQFIGTTEMEQAPKKSMGEESHEGHEIERKIEVEDSGAAQDNDAEYETARMETKRSEDLREHIMELDEEKIETTELQEDLKEDNNAVEFEMVDNVEGDATKDMAQGGNIQGIEDQKNIEVDNVEGDATKDMAQGGNIQGIEDQKNIEVDVCLSHDLVTETGTVDSEEDGGDFSFPSQTKPADFDGHPVVGSKHQISSSPKSEDSTIYGPEYELSVPLALGVFLAAAVLAASLVFLHMKHKHTATVATLAKLPPPNKLISTSISGSSENNKRRSYYQSPVDVEMVGDSGPSEVSTSLCNSSFSGRGRTKRANEEENLSNERKLRRDSAVSSSSYGSFTTYEKLSAKKGSRDEEEAMTPVRRSSRIRNQIRSP